MSIANDHCPFFAATDPRVAVIGRAARSNHDRLRIGFPGVTMRLGFSGSSLRLRATAASPNCSFAVNVDGAAMPVVRMPEGRSEVVLAAGLVEAPHHVEIVRRNETWQGIVEVDGVILAPGMSLTPPSPLPTRQLMFVGDSVTSGEGIDRLGNDDQRTQAASGDAARSYGMLLARKLDAQCHLISFGGRGLLRDWQGRRDVLNAPQFFELTVPEEPPNSRWNHSSWVPDAIFVSLGTNDFNPALGAFPDRREFVATYVEFVTRLRTLYPAAQILMTEGAIVNDAALAAKRTLREYIAETRSRVPDPKLHAVSATHYPGDATNVHPTAEQHRMMAQDLEAVFRQLLGW